MTDQAIPAWAVPGARVVCIDDSYPDVGGGIFFEKHAVYTIKEVFPVGRNWACRVRECSDPQHNARLNRFRPAIEPKSEAHDVQLFETLVKDMSIVERLDRLKELLNV